MDQMFVNYALEIIENVSLIADKVQVNKTQCHRVAQRFSDIRGALQFVEDSKAGTSTPWDNSMRDRILLVLRKGKDLVRTYQDPPKLLIRFENAESFKELHSEIDNLGSDLELPGIPATSEQLTADAEEDGKDHKELPHEYLHIPFSDIDLGGPIKELKPAQGRNSKGSEKALVHAGTWKGCDCAIKVFKSADLHWNTAELEKEVTSLVKLQHPHITQLIGFSQNEEKTYVLYERMHSDLRGLIETRKVKNPGTRPFSPTEEVSIIKQIASGMFYLHRQKIVHGELKCTNVLVNEFVDRLDVKVMDFHCSRPLGSADPQAASSRELYEPRHRPRWLAPEAFEQFGVLQPSDLLLQKQDVYSFAMTCCEVVTGGYPFDGISGSPELKKLIVAKVRPDLPPGLSSPLKGLIAACWHADPDKRPSFEDICNRLEVDTANLMQARVYPRLQKLLSSKDSVIRQAWPSVPTVIDMEQAHVAKGLPSVLNIHASYLKPVRVLGKGSQAEVVVAKWLGTKFAVKWLNCKQDHVSKLRKEVGIMMKLRHPHVIRLVGFSVMANRCGIVMELMDKSLRAWMDSRLPLSEPEALEIITRLARTMSFLHSRGVAHGDLTCENVLVRGVQTKSSEISMEMKIVDFGLSRILGQSSPQKEKQMAEDFRCFGRMCFEIITGKRYSREVLKGGGMKQLPGTMNVCAGLKTLVRECIDESQKRTFPEICETLDAMVSTQESPSAAVEAAGKRKSASGLPETRVSKRQAILDQRRALPKILLATGFLVALTAAFLAH